MRIVSRFYAPELDPQAARVILGRDESHHLARVMRIAIGDEVVVFDGRGEEVRAQVERADPKEAALRIVERLPRRAAPAVPVTLVQAVLKGDKMDHVVRDATMVGAVRIVPVVAERSAIGLAALARAHAQERWRRVAVASAKQCGQSRLPAIEAPGAFTDWLAEPFEGLRLLCLEPSAHASAVQDLRGALTAANSPTGVACIVGPEGGWSVEERKAAAEAGCVAVTLGHLTLRADAVGLIALSLTSLLSA